MLSDYQRAARYLAQTGRAMLTPRQRRRIKHKAGHQSVDATSARESQSADRKERAARKRRSTPPVQGANASVPEGAAPGRVTGPNLNPNRKNLMKTIILAIGGVLALLLGGFTASTASAADTVPASSANLRIIMVGTDAMGTDTYANRNREYVTFKNVHPTDAVDIAGVLVEDNWAHGRTLRNRSHSCNTYKITSLPGQASGAVLAPGESVTVFNGQRFGGAYKTAGGEYRLYANSDVDCGTAGQFYDNNNDAVWVTKVNGTTVTVLDSQSWDWNGGYHVFARR